MFGLACVYVCVCARVRGTYRYELACICLTLHENGACGTLTGPSHVYKLRLHLTVNVTIFLQVAVGLFKVGIWLHREFLPLFFAPFSACVYGCWQLYRDSIHACVLHRAVRTFGDL
jgi:hypothetical protein